MGILVLDGFAHGVNIGIAVHGALVVHVADIEDGLVGEQEQLVCNLLLVLVDEFDGARAASLFQRFLVSLEHLVLCFCLTVAAGLCLFLHATDAALDSLQVTQLQL